MTDFSAERSLLFFLLLNAAVFGSALLLALRSMTRIRSQALLDAALLGYAVQYVSVGLPGLLGWLHPLPVFAAALILCAALIVAAILNPSRSLRYAEEPDRFWLAGIALFVVSFVVLFAHTRADQPVFSNDAMTYHFPAAVQWLQQGKIGLFQTWFFNPANTYSPLAGSVFITWLIVPFGSDVLARFVEVPALLCVGLATYRLCRQLCSTEPGRAGPDRGGTPRLCAGFVAAAAVLARPIFEPCMMGKDDLFVAFFFIAALVALSPEASKDRWGSLRFGIALGLLLATKYTALLCAPLLLVAIDGPRWCVRRWTMAAAAAIVLAGPWYLRNWIATGNPLFPVDIPHLFHGLFTTSHSAAFASIKSASSVIVGGAYGMPIAMAAVLALAWILCLATVWRGIWSNPILRASVIGSAAGIAIFFWRSPFPEVRFFLPVFLMLFACLSAVIPRIHRREKTAAAMAGLVLLAAILTVLDPGLWLTTAWLSFISFVIASLGIAVRWWASRRPLRWILIGSICLGMFCVFAYINWAAYSRDSAADAFYAVEYPEHEPLWRAVNEIVPADATVAYTNIYLVYPMMGRSLSRRLVYVPTRSGVSSIADLGWLGSDLSGEQIIPAAVRADGGVAESIDVDCKSAKVGSGVSGDRARGHSRRSAGGGVCIWGSKIRVAVSGIGGVGVSDRVGSKWWRLKQPPRSSDLWGHFHRDCSD